MEAVAVGSVAWLIMSAVYLLTCLAVFVGAVAVYIFIGLGISGMLKKLGYKKTWMAFVPFCQTWALGYIAEQYDNGKPKKKFSKILLSLHIVNVAVSWLSGVFLGVAIPILMQLESALDPSAAVTAVVPGLLIIFTLLVVSVLSIVYAVILYIALYYIYKMFAPKNAVLFIILTVFTSLAAVVLLFVYRNKEPQGLRENITEVKFTESAS